MEFGQASRIETRDLQQVDAEEPAKGVALLDRALKRLVGQGKPLPQELQPQHALDPYR